jgi:CDGSH-type Zn-finger protein/ferredoxin
MSDDKPTIDAAEKSPFIVKGLHKLTGHNDEPIAMEKDVIALCRCGASKNKPFCDGAHRDNGFTGKAEEELDLSSREFAGQELTVVDVAGLCIGYAACHDNVPEVFFHRETPDSERASKPDAADRDEVIAAIRQCPSGSLAYKLSDELHAEYFDEPEIFVAKDGPLHVRGGIVLNGHETPHGDHYVLCRCGASKTKPFCDGSHDDIDFKG